jgi:O-acetylhomoserine/O-acetylserine sulfhydrylase-like pyridoxal-dependent enzyme
VVYTTKNRGNKARRSFVPVLCPGTAGESFERVSVGLEHPDDIVEDVLGALDQV